MNTTAKEHDYRQYRIGELILLLLLGMLLGAAFYTRQPVQPVNAAEPKTVSPTLAASVASSTSTTEPAEISATAAGPSLDSLAASGEEDEAAAAVPEPNPVATETSGPNAVSANPAEPEAAPPGASEPNSAPPQAPANDANTRPDPNSTPAPEPNSPPDLSPEPESSGSTSEDAAEPNEIPMGVPEPNSPSQLVLNFQDVPMQTILEYLSEKAGVVIVSDGPLDDRITVISRQPVTLNEAIALINTVLKENDLAAVRTGRTVRIVSLDAAKTMNLPVTSGNDPDSITAGDEMITHVIPVRYVNVAQLRENLQSLIPEYATLTANEEGNALIITDTTANIKRLMEIIRALDTHMSGVSEIRVFHLNLADATSTAELINRIFQQEDSQSRTSSQRGGPGGFMEMMMRGGPGGRGPGGRGGDRDRGGDSSAGMANAQVVAAADERTNSVVVSGPSELLDVVADVVKALDSRSAAAVDVKVFHLEYSDADNTAELVNEVFGADRSSSRSRSSGRDDTPMFFRRGPGGSDRGAGDDASASTIEVVAAADERTNSLVVTGPSDTLEVIAEVIKELDANPEQERQVFVYQLKNAEAANLKEILNSLFQEMQALNEEGAGSSTQRFQGQAGGRGGAAPGQTAGGQTSSAADLSDEAFFEADENTNSLLVLTSSKNYKKVEPIIEQLDRRLGQVLIKVLLAEVTHTDSLDLGFEFSVLNMRDDGDSTLFSSDFGVAAAQTQFGGFMVKGVEGDLTATLRALQEVGKLNILSRPYILTRDNQTATITVGEEVPFINNTRTTETGQTINTIQYEDIGIILEVTPSINPEGLVIMDVRPEISTTTAKTVPISETVDAAVFAKRSSETQVEVRDGQTIVIGGLVEDEITESIKKVPLIGDIPIIGELFKRKTKEKSKTELLIFLTPHVAMLDDELTEISEAEKSRNTLTQEGMGSELFEKHMEGMKGNTKPKNEKP